jgi:hypothetical protein
MTINDRIVDEYFEWMYRLVCEGRYSRSVSYRKLLSYLHDVEFIFSIPKDENRARDGVDLRRRFALSREYGDLSRYLDGPCSVLEMMIALAIRCEESIMDDTAVGDRTGQWFWGMVTNLGLGSMYDSNFDIEYVEDVVARFLHRKYEPNGRGGLFTVRHCDRDLRDAEIWYQLCWYLDSLV